MATRKLENAMVQEYMSSEIIIVSYSEGRQALIKSYQMKMILALYMFLLMCGDIETFDKSTVNLLIIDGNKKALGQRIFTPSTHIYSKVYICP